jgi:DNA-binding IclR family transcriptional regulator
VNEGPGAAGLDPRGVLAKVLAVLGAFGPDEHALPLAELARRTAIPKGTLHRVAADLVLAGLLERDGAEYRLGQRLFELGLRVPAERRLFEAAIPFMEDLYELTHETVHLGVREGQEVLYVGKIGGHRQADAPSRIGGRMPLHCTAIGKVLLAHAPSAFTRDYLAAGLERRGPRTVVAPGLLRRELTRIREKSLAFEHEESAAGIACVAAPVVGPDGELAGAVSVTGPMPRFVPERHARQVQAAGQGIATVLAGRAALHALGD